MVYSLVPASVRSRLTETLGFNVIRSHLYHSLFSNSCLDPRRNRGIMVDWRHPWNGFDMRTRQIPLEPKGSSALRKR